MNHDPLPNLRDIDPEDVIAREVLEHPPATNHWSAARRVALQVLYEVDCAHHPVETVIAAHLAEQTLPPSAVTFLRQLIATVLENRERVDAIVQEAAPDWPLSQIAVIDRNVLRMAVCEFAILTRTPMKVAIDEAVRLAKIFGADGSPRFVNGVLGTLANDPDDLRTHLSAPDTVSGEKQE